MKCTTKQSKYSRKIWRWKLRYLLTDWSNQTCTDSDVIGQMIFHPQSNTMATTNPETDIYTDCLRRICEGRVQCKPNKPNQISFFICNMVLDLIVIVNNSEENSEPCERHWALTADWLLRETLCEVKGHDGCGLGQSTARVLPERVGLRLTGLVEIQRSLMGQMWRGNFNLIPLIL